MLQKIIFNYFECNYRILYGLIFIIGCISFCDFTEKSFLKPRGGELESDAQTVKESKKKHKEKITRQVNDIYMLLID
jgi:hypothetical protein